MKRLNLYVLAALAALAIAGISASTAAAKAPGLVITNEEVPVAEGGAATAGFGVESCLGFYEGTLTSNGKKKDKAAFTGGSSECGPEESLTGTITSAQASTAGALSFKATLVLGQPGPCLYSIKKFSTTFEVPGEIYVSGELTAKAGKGSSKSCTKTITLPFFADLASEPFGAPFAVKIA